MSKFYLYKIWFTSAFVIPFVFALVSGKVFRITIEDISHASLELVTREIGGLAGLLFFLFICAFAVSFPILVVTGIIQYYLVQKINSEVFMRLFIIFFVAFLMFIACFAMSRSFKQSLDLAYLGLKSVVLASIYHSFRDRLDSSRDNQTLLIRFWLWLSISNKHLH